VETGEREREREREEKERVKNERTTGGKSPVDVLENGKFEWIASERISFKNECLTTSHH
jgi:hypothetical protein